MANKANAKVSNERETLNLTLSKDSTLSLFSDMLESKHNAIEEFDGQKQEVFKFSVNKGKEVTTIVVRDPASVTALTNIEKSARLQGATATLMCSEMRKVPMSTIEKSGLSALNFFKGAFGDVLSDNTISRYFRISRLFFDPTTFQFRQGLEVDTLISNLDVVLPLFKFKDRNLKIEELTEEEITAEYNAFYKEYIIKDLIHLFKPQSKLKEEVAKLLKGVVDGDSKESENKVDNSNNSDNKTDNGKISDNKTDDGKISDNKSDDSTTSDNDTESTNNFTEIAKAISIIRNIIEDDEIKAKFDEVVAYIEETLA